MKIVCFLLKLVLKILLLPVAFLLRFLCFIWNLLMQLSLWVLSPVMLFVLGCGIYSVVRASWTDVFLLTLIEMGLFAAAVGAGGIMEQLERLHKALRDKSIEFDDVVKMGRTQLQDAVPIRLGQSFEAYAAVIERDIRRIRSLDSEIKVLNIGATAVGTAINVNPVYLFHIIRNVNLVCGTDCSQAEDLFDATQNLDGFVHTSAALRVCAVNLSKICNDLRLLSSGPKAGLGEINLPPKQNGSSIMPGKINPVIPEVVSQVAYNVIGNDVTVTMAAEAGQLELNAFEPVIFYKIFESIDTLRGAVETLIDNCILGITANRERCRALVESSAALATALCPALGYKKSAEIAKKCNRTGIPVRQIVLEEGLLPEEELDRYLSLVDMTQAGHPVDYKL